MPVPVSIQENLQREFNFIDQEKVLAYLDTKPGILTKFLDTAFDKIHAYFPTSKLYLEVMDDPEIKNYTHLVITISPTDEPETAFNIFQKFKQEWWIKASNEVKDTLLIILEYK